MKKRTCHNSTRDRETRRVGDRGQPTGYEEHTGEIHEPHGPDKKCHASTAIREKMLNRNTRPGFFRQYKSGVPINLKIWFHLLQYFNNLARLASLYDKKADRFRKLPNQQRN